MLQIQFYYTDGTSVGGYNRVFINNNWLKADFCITLQKPLKYIKVRGVQDHQFSSYQDC